MNIIFVVKFQGKASVKTASDVLLSVELKNDETKRSEIREFGDENNGVADLPSETVNIQFYSCELYYM